MKQKNQNRLAIAYKIGNGSKLALVELNSDLQNATDPLQSFSGTFFSEKFVCFTLGNHYN